MPPFFFVSFDISLLIVPINFDRTFLYSLQAQLKEQDAYVTFWAKMNMDVEKI
jgi:hypothetical protein